jgi:hypothetical protein
MQCRRSAALYISLYVPGDTPEIYPRQMPHICTETSSILPVRDVVRNFQDIFPMVNPAVSLFISGVTVEYTMNISYVWLLIWIQNEPH